MKAYRGERFFSEVKLSLTQIVQFADAVGDMNPIHRDSGYAVSTRFGRPTASGPHASSLLLALTAAHFSKMGAMLGLEFWVRFRRPIYPEETIKLEWLVRKVSWNEKLKGEVVQLFGHIKGQDGKTSVSAKGRVLVMDRL